MKKEITRNINIGSHITNCMTKGALSRAVWWWVSIILIILVILTFYILYQKKIQAQLSPGGGFTQSIQKPKTCPSTPDPSYRCNKNSKAFCWDNDVCNCVNGFWQLSICPTGNACTKKSDGTFGCSSSS